MSDTMLSDTMLSDTMLSCGHAANSTDGHGNPSCAICVGIGADPVPMATPDLSGRVARCSCGHTQPSSMRLAFFEYMGEGSRRAVDSCGLCGYAWAAHDPDSMARNVPGNRRTVVEQGRCRGFVAHGAYEF
jgi:hypothetical protein